MNATTTAATTLPTGNGADGKLVRLIRAVCTEARRALELVGASYRNGPLMPL